MPCFRPDIRDLISGMMTVDPEERLTIEQIKAHPAFLFGLPYGYIIPSPLPFPALSDPIDPDNVEENILKCLVTIGMTPEEIQGQLVENTGNIAKLFVLMISQRLRYDILPWEKSITTIPDISHVPPATDVFNEIQVGLVANKQEQTEGLTKSPEIFSDRKSVV